MAEKTKSTVQPETTAESTDADDNYPFLSDSALLNDPSKCVDYIAKTLNENKEKPLTQIEQIVDALGTKKTLKMLRRTLQIEEGGGMLIYNQSRRRTPGGVFFFLAQRWVNKKHRVKIWPEMYPNEPLDWDDRLPLVKQAHEELGQAGIPRMVLIGQPGRVIERGKVVLTSLQRQKLPKSMPKDLPDMPDKELPYIVYISAKQWRKVKPTLKSKKDEIIVEGYPAFNPQLKAITIFATRTTSKGLDKARRNKQRSATAKE